MGVDKHVPKTEPARARAGRMNFVKAIANLCDRDEAGRGC
jgi:hypothetical protein